MKVVDIVCGGVHRLVPVTDSAQLNYWEERGYTPYKVNGQIQIKELQTENTIGKIANPELRDAILASERNSVKDMTPAQITKEVAEAFENAKTTK